MTSSRLTTVRTRLAIAGLSIALLPHATPSSRQGFSALEPGKATKRPLARGEAHRYQIGLAAGELEEVIVEQHGIDLNVFVRDAGGSTIADVDDETGRDGREQVALVAIAEGTFTVTIESARGTVLPGSYTIRAGPRRMATESDRSFQASLTLKTAAARLETEGRFDEARRSLERALTLTESARGPNDVQVAAVAAQLAGVHRKLADGAAAECLYSAPLQFWSARGEPDIPPPPGTGPTRGALSA